MDNGHFSILFGFDFPATQGCKISQVWWWLKGGRTTAENRRDHDIMVLKPWCSGRSYSLFFQRGTWPDSQKWKSDRSVCLENSKCLPRVGWLVANLITCFSISANLTWECPHPQSQGGVCGPTSHELLDATHGGLIDLFANAAWTQIREGPRPLIFRDFSWHGISLVLGKPRT